MRNRGGACLVSTFHLVALNRQCPIAAGTSLNVDERGRERCGSTYKDDRPYGVFGTSTGSLFRSGLSLPFLSTAVTAYTYSMPGSAESSPKCVDGIGPAVW